MSVPFFSICKACRKYKTWASTIEEKEEEKKTRMQGNLFYTILAKGKANCCQFVMHNQLLAFREQSREKLFQCPDLYNFTS